ncbi:alpha/beta hydrolase [Microbispora sp. KK1-11]|uniref:alpha/beta hydrolase n=1 Tax=Microbispora sp. KK1-11 TaxID=2053005 RepID=UPI00115ABD18|nr:alpha/beta hydrolase [Microbispora sp. KK1-11]TQS25419.1 alpha/beta hydrolase [Microbispora sp. KK1-11]
MDYRLDPELAVVAAGLPRTDFTDPVAARKAAYAVASATVAALPPAGDVEITDHQADGVPVRIYRPTTAAEPAPVLLDFHGGGFVMGSLDSEHRRALDLARRARCVVISVDYRLAPEHPFPAGLDDGYTVLEWTSANAASLGVDPARVAVGGGSAGGGLAAGLALLARDRGGPAIAFQLLLCPALDDRLLTWSATRFTGTPAFDSRAAAQMWPLYLPAGRVSPYAAPSRADDLTGLPPAYVLTAEYDPLRDEAVDYAVRLLQANVSVELHQTTGTFHVFDHVAPEAAVSRRARAEMAHALARGLAAVLPRS